MKKVRRNNGPFSENGAPLPPGPQTNHAYAAEPFAGTGYYQPPVKHSSKTIFRLIASLALICLVLILLQSVLFRMKTVYVIGATSRSAEEIAALSGLVKGESIVAVTEGKVRRNLESDHWVTLVHLYKQYPNEVFLVVDEREIAATMQWLGIEYTLDIDGMVLDEYSDMDFEGELPIVYGFKVGNVSVGEILSVRSEAQLVAYSSIVSELTIQQYIDKVASINVSDPDALSLLTASGITVQLGNSDYMRAKIGAMRTDIAYLHQVGESSGVLDVSVPEDGRFKREQWNG